MHLPPQASLSLALGGRGLKTGSSSPIDVIENLNHLIGGLIQATLPADPAPHRDGNRSGERSAGRQQRQRKDVPLSKLRLRRAASRNIGGPLPQNWPVNGTGAATSLRRRPRLHPPSGGGAPPPPLCCFLSLPRQSLASFRAFLVSFATAASPRRLVATCSRSLGATLAPCWREDHPMKWSALL